MLEVINRKTQKKEQEKVDHEKSLLWLYSGSFFSKIILFFIARFTLFSKLFGFLQTFKYTKKKIKPFIEEYQIDTSEFEKKVEDFSSFNDFFIRKIKNRFIEPDEKKAILPVDGRYLVFEDVSKTEGFYVKGEKFSLQTLLQDEALASRYASGSMIIARLAPSDYHRFHFPVNCVPSSPKLINGYLYSVNPYAIKKNIQIFSQNKRVITTLESDFGEVLFVEVGATIVGNIHQSYEPDRKYLKGEEKGYFALGGSTVILLFEKNRIYFDADLLQNSLEKIETKASMGQSLGQLL